MPEILLRALYKNISFNPHNSPITLRLLLSPFFQMRMLSLRKVKKIAHDVPGGAVVKNPPANAGDTGSNPGPGRFHMPWSN